MSSIIDDGFGWISLLKIKSTVAPLIVAKVSTLLLDTIKTDICNYDGSFKRNMEVGEEEWIVSKCRYNP